MVDATNYQTARTNLQNSLAEHIQKYPNADTRRDFNFGEKTLIIHALNHLNAVINKNDPPYKDENGITKHQSDIVNSTLLETPKQDYN